MIKLKRAYDAPARGDGTRFLVDRLWPRGIRKADLSLDGWLEDVAPSTELRRWFAHDYSARDTEHNAAVVLRDYLAKHAE
jgi:uncharacterized protein YeaO (DUF488 family)